MADKKEIQKQNLQDLLQVCVVLGQILEEKELTKKDLERIDYCEKNIITVTKKILNNKA